MATVQPSCATTTVRLDPIRHPATVFVTVAVMAAVGAACGAGDRDHVGAGPGPGEVLTMDSSGVVVVVHGDLRDGDALPRLELTPEPVLTIGQTEGDAPYLLKTAHQARFLSDGTIAISEPMDGEIRIFDPGGRFLRSHGGAGEGPGEFVQFAWFEVVQGDSLRVWDSRTGRLTLFAPDGSPRVERIAHVPGVAPELTPFAPEAAFQDGSLLLRLHGEAIPMAGAVSRDLASVARWTRADPARLDTLLTYPVVGEYVDENHRIRPGFVQFRHGVVRTVHGPRFFSGSTSAFSIEVRDVITERLETVIRVAEPPAPIPSTVVEEFWERRMEAAAPGERALVREIRAQMPVPEHFPAISRLLVSGEGDIWARRYPLPAAANQVWHVFDRNGVHRARIEIPDELFVLDVSGDRLLARHRDELRVPTVRVYGLR
jgi:hypothetical protein